MKTDLILKISFSLMTVIFVELIFQSLYSEVVAQLEIPEAEPIECC